MVVEHIPHPFFMNGVGPFGSKQTRQSQVHQQAAQLSGIKNARIQDRYERAHNQ